jgi:hypothetical protein
MFNLRERHFTVAELASWLNLSYDATLDLFRHEPGVVKIFRPRKRVRRYTTIRIPQSVAERVYQRLTNGGQR